MKCKHERARLVGAEIAWRPAVGAPLFGGHVRWCPDCGALKRERWVSPRPRKPRRARARSLQLSLLDS